MNFSFEKTSELIPKEILPCANQKNEIPKKYGKKINSNYVIKPKLLVQKLYESEDKSSEIDVFCQLPVLDTLDKMFEFEINLFHPDMTMIVGVLKRQPEKITDVTNVIGSTGEEVTKIYLSLLMLRRPRTAQEITTYLQVLGPKISSDLTNVDEILRVACGLDAGNMHLPTCLKILNAEPLSPYMTLWEDFYNQKLQDHQT